MKRLPEPVAPACLEEAADLVLVEDHGRDSKAGRSSVPAGLPTGNNFIAVRILKVDLCAELEVPRRHDLQRIAICRPRCRGWSRVVPLVHFSRIRVEQVVDVDVRVGPAFLEDPKLEDFAHPKIQGIQAIAIEHTGVNDVQELDRVSAAERPPERRLAADREHRSAKALALHRGEFVAGKRQAAERPAELYVELRYVVDRQSLHVRLPSRLAVAERLRPLPGTSEERVEEPVRAAPGTEDVELRVIMDNAAGVLDDVPAARAALDRNGAQTCVHGDVEAVEIIKGAAHVVGERQEVIGLLELCLFDVV